MIDFTCLMGKKKKNKRIEIKEKIGTTITTTSTTTSCSNSCIRQVEGWVSFCAFFFHQSQSLDVLPSVTQGLKEKINQATIWSVLFEHWF